MAKIQRGKTVCLITTGHIASDPRLVKEGIALSKAGFKVHIVFTQYVSYLVEHDRRILNDNPEWTYQTLNWTGDSLQSKINRLSSKLISLFSAKKELALNRNLFWQQKKATNYKADLYIAHNLGALPVVVSASKKNNTKCGFDAEDFHRHEVSDDVNDVNVKLKTAIENRYIPQADYITASSPQIADKYASLFDRRITTVLNVFPKINSYNKITNDNATLKLFWFSQTIGTNRGIETAIEGIRISGIKAELHLLGYLGDDYMQHLHNLTTDLNHLCTIYFHAPVYADELFGIAAQFDIGLATEPYQPLNRNICLTNKLFTYIQCGLAVIASNTIAQKAFLSHYSDAGKLYSNADEFAYILTEYNTNRKLLHTTKQNNFKLGQTTLNWENESKKFIKNIYKVLDLTV